MVPPAMNRFRTELVIKSTEKSFGLREGQSGNPFCPVILSEVEGRAKRLERMARSEGTRPKKLFAMVNSRGLHL